MLIDKSAIEAVKATVESGYYERKQITRRERKSLSDAIEKACAEGRAPILLELKCADLRNGQYFTNRNAAHSALGGLAGFAPMAYSMWIEPRFHAGDIKWLEHDYGVPVLAKDLIISERQMVGGDAVLLSLPVLSMAEVDPHTLIEAAHDFDLEVVLEAYTPTQLDEAKRTEADIIAINNYGPNGSPANISTTLEMLSNNKTGRPIISSEGISHPAHVRALLGAGVGAIEVGPEVWSREGGKASLERLSRAVLGKEPETKNS